MRIFTLVFLLVGGCAHVRWLQSEHPSPPTMECAQTMRIFPDKFADRVVDATSYEEVDGILGLPSHKFGSGVVHNEWVFDNGEVYEINSLSLSEIAQQGKKQPVGIMFPCWRVKRQRANAGTGRCVVATVGVLRSHAAPACQEPACRLRDGRDTRPRRHPQRQDDALRQRRDDHAA